MKNYWTNERLELLRQLWVSTRDWQVVKERFPELPLTVIIRTYYRHYKGQKVGRLNYWTPERDALLLQLWEGEKDLIKFKSYFPEKPFSSIRKRAQELGINRKRNAL